MFRRLLLLSPDPQPPAGTPPPEGTPPPAATVVQDGKLTEGDAAELVALRQEKEKLARTVKDREMRLAELEDQNHQLKTIHRQPEPKRTRGGGWTFFHGNQDQD